MKTMPYVRPLSVFAFLAASVSANGVNVATFSVTDLLTGRRSDELAIVLSTTGLLAVEGVFVDSSEALEGLCHCQDGLLKVDGTDTALLDDGITLRRTLATATAGTSPLPLPENLANACGPDTASAMESLRDKVAEVSDAFVVALDRLLGASHEHPLLRNTYGVQYASVSAVRGAANHLEHFHLYAKPESTSSMAQDTLQWHTDAGLFLAFVPAQDCQGSHEADSSFWVLDSQQQPTQAVFPPGSVAIMLGAGAQHWLETTFPLKAAKHAVKMNPGDSRAWYGMMHLVPESAIVQSVPERTFGDMRAAMALSAERPRLFGDVENNQAISIGCGFGDEKTLSSPQSSSSPSRRRLQHAQDPSACNNVTNFFCWMSCLDVPNYKQTQGYINEGYSLYCLDPAILASSGNQVSKAVEPCDGTVHNSNCMGSWRPTAPGVEAAQLKLDAPSDISEQFCYGGTSMYMDGFHWMDTTCVIYLFPAWVLSTPGKLAGASIGTLVFGIALEKVIQQRRLVVTSLSPGYRRLGMSALFYGMQLTMGYFLMLVVMTYSGPLFMCVVLGLVGGHILFNAKDAILVKKDSSRECEKSKSGGEESSSEEGTKSGCMEENAGVPEGSTPCCQHAL